MLEQIHQAEAAIKDGDTKTGFEILRQVLEENPNSERAWWVMSGLVPREQRAHCLNEVLRINPENHFAREALEKLGPLPPDKPAPEIAPAPKKGGVIGEYQTWLFAQRSLIHLTLVGSELIRVQTEPKFLSRLRTAIKEGDFPDSLVKNKTIISLDDITRINQTKSVLQVYFQFKGKEDSIRLELENEAIANEVLTALHGKLGYGFSLRTEPAKIGTSIIISTILILGAVGLTTLLIWGAQEVTAETGRIRAQSMINFLRLLGPTGAVIIGGIMILFTLAISVWLLLKPPSVTELTQT